ncbi:MAG: associated protein [Firmicutes bacterium]|nr:associated protein [Bacillota bacterium]
MTRMTSKIMLIIKFGVLVAVVLIYWYLPGVQKFIFTSLSYLQQHDFDEVRQYILSYGVWAPIMGIMLMVIQSLVPLVPGLAITLANAWIFGWHLGGLYSWIGALSGAALDFGVAKWYGRPVVERLVDSKYLDKINGFLERNGVLAVFITRLIPLVPFKLISYGAGFTAMPFWQFVWATAIGQTPAIVLYSILGQYLTKSLKMAVVITTLLMLCGGAVWYYRKEIRQRIFFCKNKE